MPSRKKMIISWILRSLVALILLQTLYFKFTAAPESVYIFSRLSLEPWGRISTGIMELIASVLILIPRTKVPGALLGLGIMAGAIASHFLFLGIEVQNDGGLLFFYATLVFASSLAVVLMHWKEFMAIIPARFVPSKYSHS